MRKRLIALLTLGLITIGAHALATPNSTRIESPKTANVINVPTQETTQPETPENRPEEKPVVETPTPAPIDPNGCEAKGMYWRADNFECIAKPTPVAESKAVSSQPTVQTGTGDCSLVNNYDWPVATAMRVCMQESGGNPNNANWKDDHTSWANCMGSFGLFQINCSHGQVYDGPANVAIAYAMWKGSGGTFWKYWPNTCTKVGC